MLHLFYYADFLRPATATQLQYIDVTSVGRYGVATDITVQNWTDGIDSALKWMFNLDCVKVIS
jgi:hypothetical protein